MRTWLKELREKKKLTQSEVAQKMGVGQNTYSRIETGVLQDDLNLSTMILLSKVFKISLNDIRRFEESRVAK